MWRLTQAKSSKITSLFLKEEKICYKIVTLLHFVFWISQLSEIDLQRKPTIEHFNPFAPRESEFFEDSKYSSIRIRRLKNTPNQLRISSTFRKTKSEHLIRFRSQVIPPLQSWHVIGPAERVYESERIEG